MSRLLRLRYVLVGLLVLLVVATGALWTVPADDFIFTPDRAKPLADRVRVEGARPDGEGDVYYVDVFVRRATWLEQLLPFTQPEGADVVPEHALLPPGTSEQERNRQNARLMQQSEIVASAVALQALGFEVTSRPRGARIERVTQASPADGKLRGGDIIVSVDGSPIRTIADLQRRIGDRRPGEPATLGVRRDDETVTVSVDTVAAPDEPGRPIIGVLVTQEATIELPIDVDIDLGRVGGPSAGLPFALEVARMLGRDVTHGCEIAATGELALDGSVLPVGGLKQKTIGARRTGVDLFLVPAGQNAAEARAHADGLRIVPVESFQQALRELATPPANC